MAHIGMKRPVAGKLGEDGTYSDGFVVGKAISFTGTPTNGDVELRADDEVAETDKSIQDMGVSLNVDDLSLKVYADLLGHDYVAAVEGDGDSTPSTPESVEIGTDDVAPYVGLAFYKRRRKNNVTTFTAIFLRKVQFSEPTENGNTKGGTTEFQTPTIEGKAYPLEITVDGTKKNSVGKKATFTTEAAAAAWCDEMVGMESA